ncbi:MAG: hypothetical protein M3444_03565 [Acidobacteriota bacterium]|nr:hypothetical protein [Acidobacteriota bacterium]MDQ5835785.1 hypothetical protein [Acidobacteriota bacterium]
MAEETKNRREIVVINRSESREPDRWGKIERISRILSVAAIPVVLAIGGWIVQHQMQNQAATLQQQLQNQTVSKDYVQLAVSILREPDKSKVSPEMRDWAVNLLNAYSAVKLNDDVAKKLKEGQTVLPPLESFTAEPSSGMTPEMESKLRPVLEEFQQYLSKAGFRIASSGEVKYRVVEGDKKTGLIDGYVSFYENRTLTVARQHLGDSDLIRHEYMRHVLDPDFPDSHNYNDPRWWSYFAVNSGLAIYFPCSFKKTPSFAPGDKDLGYELKSGKRFNGRPRNMEAADSVGNEVWGSAFWELREKIGDPSVADNLLALSWVSWQPGDPDDDLFAAFVKKMIEVDQSRFSGQHVTTIQEIFRRRGLQV